MSLEGLPLMNSGVTLKSRLGSLDRGPSLKMALFDRSQMSSSSIVYGRILYRFRNIASRWTKNDILGLHNPFHLT